MFVHVRGKRHRRLIVAFIVLVVIAGAGVLVAIFVPPMRHGVALFVVRPGIEQGVVILGTLATITAVIVALATSRNAAVRQDIRDRIESRAALERRAERQAVMVTVFNGGTVGGGQLGDRMVWRTRTANASDRPIFKVLTGLDVEIAGVTETKWAQPIDAIAGGGSSATGGAGIETAEVFSEDRNTEVRVIGMRASFLDVYGDTWTLSPDGSLELSEARVITERRS